MGNQADKLVETTLEAPGTDDQRKSIINAVTDNKEETLCGKLTLRQRVMGWLSCSVIGMLMSIIVSILFIFTSFDVAIYAVLYSIGQVLNIVGSCFLCTPKSHLKSMVKKERIVPSLIYVGAIILTVVFALATKIKMLVLLCLIIQMLAYYWYCISYIPYGQKSVSYTHLTLPTKA